MYPAPIQKLIELFSRFPTIGSRTATRFVFYLLTLNQSDRDALVSAIQELGARIKLCSSCFASFDSLESPEAHLCSICSDKSRDTSLLCVVEKESDLVHIEKMKAYKGRYFILGGTVAGLRKEDISSVRTNELKDRVKEGVTEILLALNPTTEGETTILYLKRLLENTGIRMTQLARGLPTGAELEYADDETLKNALEGRK